MTMRVLPTVFLVPLFLVFSHPMLIAQESTEDQIRDLKKEIEVLKEGQKEIQETLDEMKGMLNSPQQPQRPGFREFTHDISGEPAMGSDEAQVALLEFTDYQCPFCKRHASQTLPQIKKEYVDTGKIKYVLLDLPLQSIHKFAFKAAEAAHCAGEQKDYWEMHDLLFENNSNLTAENLSVLATDLSLDTTQFNECLTSEKYAAQIRKDMAVASSSGLTGTPSFAIGLIDREDPKTVRVVQSIRGAQSFPTFKAQIEALLTERSRQD